MKYTKTGSPKLRETGPCGRKINLPAKNHPCRHRTPDRPNPPEDLQMRSPVSLRNRDLLWPGHTHTRTHCTHTSSCSTSHFLINRGRAVPPARRKKRDRQNVPCYRPSFSNSFRPSPAPSSYAAARSFSVGTYLTLNGSNGISNPCAANSACTSFAPSPLHPKEPKAAPMWFFGRKPRE